MVYLIALKESSMKKQILGLMSLALAASNSTAIAGTNPIAILGGYAGYRLDAPKPSIPSPNTIILLKKIF